MRVDFKIAKWIFFVFLASACNPSGPTVLAAEPKPFVTDYCTGFPEGTPENPNLWASCCMEHDLWFWAGGTPEERVEADRELRNCVEDSGAPVTALLMWIGVRMGSHSPVKVPGKQWGNAWGSGVRREALRKEEIDLLEESLRSDSDLDLAVIVNFVKALRTRVGL